MKYMLLMYANESEHPKPSTQEFQAAGRAWQAFGTEAAAAGVLLANSGLAPVASATTVRVRDGKILTIDGPFAETHEQLAGYYLLDCKDLDDVLGWAAKLPTAQYGSVEVRPVYGY